ncbi:MAG: polysaccharide biosynthesis/export family protein [Leeuwenhoekiella sp.]
MSHSITKSIPVLEITFLTIFVRNKLFNNLWKLMQNISSFGITKLLIRSVILFGVFPFLLSCGNTKDTIYFRSADESSYASFIEKYDDVIQPNDLLSITVTDLNEEATAIFNNPNVSTGQIISNSGFPMPLSGYLVNNKGYITFPVLGDLKAWGKTKRDLAEEIETALISQKLLIEPIVQIRYLNFRVSVLGEVGKPSVLVVQNEKISVLEALGMAGDITIFGKRDDVLLIRESAGVKKLIHLDLTSEEIFSSPYYYLKTNDVLYIRPIRARIASTSVATQWLPIIISVLSLAIIAVDRL